MESVGLTQLATIADIIGALALVLTLIFVGLEIRQTTVEYATNKKSY
jgi:hypothetical protein